MTNTNFFVEIGNVVRDIGENDFAILANGSGKLNFAIAVNHSKKQGEEWIDEVSYLDFVCFGKLAENMKNFIKKGVKVCVTGRIKQDRWTKDGKNFSKLTLIAENIELLSRKEGGQNTANNQPVQQSTQNFANESGFPEDVPWN